MSNYILPIILILIIIYGYYKKINVYDSFVKGSLEGIELSLSIFPSILAIIFSSRIFITSGFLDYLLKLVRPILDLVIPYQLIPIILLRPISFNGSLSLMIEIFEKYTPDSYIGTLSSVIQGCMDTTVYIMALYFGAIGIKKARKTIVLSIILNIIAVILSILLVNLTFN